jgi:hypothetical protein
VGTAVIDAGTLEVVDLTEIVGDGQVRCQWFEERGPEVQCTKEATWAGSPVPCGHQALACDTHHKQTVDAMARGVTLTCSLLRAEHHVDRVDWREL